MRQRRTETAPGVVSKTQMETEKYDEANGSQRIKGHKTAEDMSKTDAETLWKIQVTDDTIIFVIKPRGYMTPVKSKINCHKFY